ncbi:Matrixin [Aquisphaera giovannonii]|uniref:Matrixin n=1 Tax=Aquisphaera giovannonii TaxID=406548 RepID=A0A5B9WBS9_9BACT|nr:matrixin family metalloprotease [Aquisphaera giovannonii]QEH37669.1 Matrixin [Aquisphaera giovannonii]
MMRDRRRGRLSRREPGFRAVRPLLEGLEDRFLLYATTSTQWAKPKLITYSFVPDGTSIGGVPSNLQATLNARFATADWKAQFAKAATVWQKVANVNFSLVPDNGAPLGTSGNQQSDPRFGDIRIGGYAMAGNILAFAYLAPPANGGTNAGDMFFNTTQLWQINGTTVDLETVAIHEFGHALGMGHTTDSAAAMYPTYVTTKQAVDADDTNGIRTIYNSRQNDFFDANGANDSSRSADDISSYLYSNGQLTLSALDSTTPIMIGVNDVDWYKVTAPASTTGTMVVRMQSTNLSLLAPTLSVYNGAGTTMLGQKVSYNMGDTVAVTINGVVPGQVFDIRAQGSTTGDAGFGAYGLQVNFGSLQQPPVTSPNTTMAETADRGGGTMNESTDPADDSAPPQDDASVIPGIPTFWVYNDDDATVSEDAGVVGPNDTGGDSSDTAAGSSDGGGGTTGDGSSTDGTTISVGDLTGQGDALMIDPSAGVPRRPRAADAAAPWAPLWWSARPARPAAMPVQAPAEGLSLITTIDFLNQTNDLNLPFMTLTRPKKQASDTRPAQIVDLAIATGA